MPRARQRCRGAGLAAPRHSRSARANHAWHAGCLGRGMLHDKRWVLLGWIALVPACSDDAPAREVRPDELTDGGLECELNWPGAPRHVAAGRRCDGHVDCYYGDDERDCPGQYVCEAWSGDPAEGRATVISPDAVCDGTRDCLASDDEMHCGDRKQVICVSDDGPNYVVIGDRICDGKQHCSYYSEDEQNCPDSFVCAWHDGLGTTVIPRSQVCDGRWNCWEDELDCPGIEAFACTDGHTIPAASKCDGYPQCPDGSDEKMELCQQFRCWTGPVDVPDPASCVRCPQRIPIAQRCDGRPDCRSGEDELGC